MDEKQVEKNAKILKQEWIEKLEGAMEDLEAAIKEDFYSGVWGLLFNRMVARLYSLFLSKDIKKKLLKQFDLLIKAGKEYNGNSNEVLEKYFPEYLANDPGYERCKKTHSKTPELRDRIKKSFALMVKNSNDLLNSSGDCYEELMRNAYKTKDAAWKATFCLIDDAEEDFQFTIHHKMLKISSLIRQQTIKLLQKEIEISREYYTKKLNEIYGN
ncbi:MAG: hypothetical protein LUQ65_02820 [Candidatus Helarchaeota archaeon]|nr:hypothetical protein [Candidatus Helarchaeota archaeon]